MPTPTVILLLLACARWYGACPCPARCARSCLLACRARASSCRHLARLPLLFAFVRRCRPAVRVSRRCWLRAALCGCAEDSGVALLCASGLKDTLGCVGKNDGRSHWRYPCIVCQAAAAMWLDRQLCRFAGGRGMHSACCVSKGSVNSCRPDAAQRAANSASRAAHRCAEVSRVFRGCPARKVMMCHP